MHVVMFVDFPDSSLGGVQTSVRAQRKALEKLGHQVTMVTPPAKRPETVDPNVILAPALPYSPYEYPLVAPSRRNERFIERELAKRPPIDIIHAQTNTGLGIMAIHIARRLKKPLVQTMHTRDDVFIQKTVKYPWLVTTPAYFIHRALLRAPRSSMLRVDEPWSVRNSWRVMVHHAQQADVVTTPSRHFADRLIAHGVTKPVEVVSNGLDDDMLNELWKHQAEDYTASKPLNFIWVNRLSAEKRPLLALEAIKDIPDVTLDFYGEGPDEPLMKKYIREQRLNDRVRLNGRVSQAEVLAAIARSDAFILSSYQFDSQSMVLLESIAMGVPAVISDPDLAESVPAGGGVVTKTPDLAGLREAIADLAANPQKLTAMRKVLRAHRGSVAQSRMTAKMIGIYEKLI